MLNYLEIDTRRHCRCFRCSWGAWHTTRRRTR